MVVSGCAGKLNAGLPVKGNTKTCRLNNLSIEKLNLGRERKEGVLFKSVQEPEFAFVYENKKLAGELMD